MMVFLRTKQHKKYFSHSFGASLMMGGFVIAFLIRAYIAVAILASVPANVGEYHTSESSSSIIDIVKR